MSRNTFLAASMAGAAFTGLVIMPTVTAQGAKPRIVIVATGGTIAGAAASTTAAGYKSGAVAVDVLIDAVPQMKKFADVRGVQVSSVGSQDMNDELWVKLATEVNGLLSKPDVDGVAITHGTDTMEETAYFLNLVVKSDKPVVLTGSMRPSTSLSADGPLNIYNAVGVASDPRAKGRGVLVVANDDIHGARAITKRHTTDVETFVSPEAGLIGVCLFDDRTFSRSPLRGHTTATPFKVTAGQTLPRVDIIYAHAGMSPDLIDAAVANGAKGLVIAGVGDGNMTTPALDAVKRAVAKGVLVVRSSRVGDGFIRRNIEVEDDKIGTVASQELNPSKARVLLKLALTQTSDARKVQEFFDKYLDGEVLMEPGLTAWIAQTLRTYPELAVFFALAVGFAVGPRKLKGFTLGNVTATLLAGVLIGQLGITVGGPIKSTFFLLFLFAVGFGVGPQFFRGLGKEGPRQIVFSLIVLVLCLVVPVLCAMAAGLDLGYAAGLYAGSQTISAAIGVATDQIDRLGYTPEQAKAYTDAIPIGYAVTYIFGTIGSAIVLAQIGPRLIGVDLAAACAEYERQLGGGSTGADAGVFSAYRAVELRAYRVDAASGLTGRPVRELFPGLRVFVERLRRGDTLMDVDADTSLAPGDVIAMAGPRQILVEHIDPLLPEVHDAGLLDVPATAVDVFMTNTELSGKTLRELADRGFARGIHLRKITRNMVEMPILPETEVLRGDILTIAGSTRNVNRAVDALGVPDRPLETTDLMTVAGGILAGALLGAITINVGGVPISLSTSGGALLAGLVLGYLRAVRPTFGRIPSPALVLMNTLGLNVFIAIVGINAGPGFIAGLQEVGISLFVWGIVATSVPMVLAVLLGHHVFKFHPAILFGVCAGVRTTTAALGMIQDAAKSKVPALGYGMPYAIGNTLLTIFGMAVVLWMSRFG